MNFGPQVPSHGPSPCRIAIVAEAPGDNESDQLKPLVGASGHELRRMLRTVGANLDDCFKTNVFSRQPSGNNLALYGVDRSAACARALSLGPLTTNPITYLAEQHLPELDRLRSELTAVAPNIIIALGNTACWALIGQQGINNLRGTVHVSDFIPGCSAKVLPTFHPAAVLRQWDQRVIALADLAKALLEAESPSLNYDNSELWLNPTYPDMLEFERRFMQGILTCATDVETKRGQITCVSFAPTPAHSICVPFWQEGPSPHYWPTLEAERLAWRWCFKWWEHETISKVTQNGLYDAQYAIRHGSKPRKWDEDTMLAHHSLFSELRKGLGFLGSVYTNTASWKFMRTAKLEEQLKRDD